MPITIDASPPPATPWLAWVPVAAGLVVLCVPTFYELATTIWQEDEYAHGPIILALVAWLIWRTRHVLHAANARPARLSGLSILVPGLMLYLIGRSQAVSLFEVGALVPILIGTIAGMRGWGAVRAMWFPILFVAFMVPLPGTFVDALTGPLKQHVSALSEQILYALGYPIARDGVMLTIGPYRMLVADACSGLNSMFSLSALGGLYLYLVHRESVLHNSIVLACILPIAFVANVVRVLALVLITYHFGDEAGQGFLHGAAGMVLVMAGLASLLLLDAVLTKFIGKQRGGSAA